MEHFEEGKSCQNRINSIQIRQNIKKKLIYHPPSYHPLWSTKSIVHNTNVIGNTKTTPGLYTTKYYNFSDQMESYSQSI